MSSGIEGIRPKLKETLYRALEHLQATKAALYLLEDNRYSLVTQYGFRGGEVRESWDTFELLPDVLTTRRVPFYLNSLTEDPRFSEILYEANTSRILVAPVYSRGRLVGLLDLRDKGRQAAFSEADLQQVQAIVDALLELFGEHRLFGQQSQEARGTAPEIIRTPEPAAAPRGGSTIVEDAQAALGRGLLRGRTGRRGVSEAQIQAAALMLPAIVSIPGAVAAVLTAASRLNGSQVIASRAVLSDEAMEELQGKIRSWLRKRVEGDQAAARTQVIYPFGSAGAVISPDRVQSVLTAPVALDGEIAMVLTVAFEMKPQDPARSSLEDYLARVQQLGRLAAAAEENSSLREQAARYLLEPDLERYPRLVEHSQRVSELAERLALHVGLEAAEVETIRLAGLVHDVGMRLLDYERLYSKPQLSSDELRYLRHHPVVGAAIIAESPLGKEVATLVLHHHERPDGTGYPDRIAGEAIPAGARIIAICEAFDAMTAAESYRPSVPLEAALGKIRRSAGEQFDAELAQRFAEMMQESAE